MNVSIDPQEVVASILTPVLNADILNPVGRTIIQGMDYETGAYKSGGNTRFATVPFERQHKKPHFLVLVYSNDEKMIAKTTYGEFFVNYLELFGSALKQAPSYGPVYGTHVTWRTANTTTLISTTFGNITVEAGLRSLATEENFTFGGGGSDVYIRGAKTYNWIAVFMPE